VPDLAAWVGIGLLCGTGLYLLRRARPRPIKPLARSSSDASES
jgi:hypothetical protein